MGSPNGSGSSQALLRALASVSDCRTVLASGDRADTAGANSGRAALVRARLLTGRDVVGGRSADRGHGDGDAMGSVSMMTQARVMAPQRLSHHTFTYGISTR
eukprot:357218-Chlamydomonas_euryale.AAC.31